MPNWSGSTRKATLPPDWQQRRQAVFKRDGYQCTHIRHDTGQRCTQPATDCDHTGDRQDHRLQSLTSLCSYHHQGKSSSQGGKANKPIKETRPQEQHPGLNA
ncbi:hypothetical protein GCM10009569_34820 [Arthrobacter russicus]|uniref:5-methylcytosine-specific restriction endonuclease McrA n=1 Tax=Arthrobacter russicus TaxID=172040 RepID=A0ABU1JGV4_9MICC|nr:5-methylcytosine-specific restriction endonuclease McrA [Arthrobacter russicus]